MSQRIYLVIRHTRGRPLYTLDRSLALRLAGLPEDTELHRNEMDGLPSAQDDEGNNHVIEWENQEGEYDGESCIWVARNSDGAILDVSGSMSTMIARLDPDSEAECDNFSLMRGATEQDI